MTVRFAAATLLLTACTAATPSGATVDPSAARSPALATAAEASTDEQPAAPASSGTAPSSGASWRPLPEAPIAATEVAAAPYGGRVWVVGGLDQAGRPLAAVQVFDPATGSWSPGPELPVGVHHASLVVAGDRLHLVGGFLNPLADGAASRPSDEVWLLDADGGGWSEGQTLPEPRGAGAAAWDGSRLLYAGGVGPAGVSGVIFALDGDGWREIGALTEPRQHLAAASDLDGRVWFLAGRAVSLAENTGSADLLTGAEVLSLGEPLTPRSGLGAFWSPGRGACAVGGETTGGTLSSVECVDATGQLTALPDLGVARHGVGSAILDGLAYVLLGGTEPGLTVSGVGEALPLD